MGGRGAGAGLTNKRQSSEPKAGVLGKVVGERKDGSKLNWWINKQLEGETNRNEINKLKGLQQDIMDDRHEVVRESSNGKSVLVKNNDYDFPVQKWIPKSVMPTLEKTYASNGKFKPGMKVKNEKWGGEIIAITATTTYIKTKNGNTMSVKNENMDNYFK